MGTTMISDKIIPWEDVINKTIWYTAYRENDEDGKALRYIFIIKDKNGSGLSAAVQSCYDLGKVHQQLDNWNSYQIKVPIGPESGAEIDQLYVELAPIKKQYQLQSKESISNASNR